MKGKSIALENSSSREQETSMRAQFGLAVIFSKRGNKSGQEFFRSILDPRRLRSFVSDLQNKTESRNLGAPEMEGDRLQTPAVTIRAHFLLPINAKMKNHV